MTKELIGSLAIGVVALIALVIFLSNRKLRSKQEALLAKPEDFAGSGAAGLYVSTVFTDKPLDRVWAYGLGVRGRCQIVVTDAGVGISRVGEQGLLIPAQAMVAIGLQSATIDKGVEKNGLLAIDWQLGDSKLTTVLRIANVQDRKKILSDVEKLIGVSVG